MFEGSANYSLAAVVLPPTSLLLLALAGLLLQRWWRRTGALLAVGALLALLVLSTPLCAYLLLRTLEPAALRPGQLGNAQAIVILAGGRHRSAPEWGGETVNLHTLVRLRYGAELARRSGLPVLVTGGSSNPRDEPEARQMQRVLEREFAVPTRWVEQASRTTQENADLSARILLPLDIRRVVLVTEGFHMPRAQLVFQRAGFDVVPAPTGLQGWRSLRSSAHLLPSSEALRLSHIALREWVALLLYRLRD